MTTRPTTTNMNQEKILLRPAIRNQFRILHQSVWPAWDRSNLLRLCFMCKQSPVLLRFQWNKSSHSPVGSCKETKSSLLWGQRTRRPNRAATILCNLGNRARLFFSALGSEGRALFFFSNNHSSIWIERRSPNQEVQDYFSPLSTFQQSKTRLHNLKNRRIKHNLHNTTHALVELVIRVRVEAWRQLWNNYATKEIWLTTICDSEKSPTSTAKEPSYHLDFF